MPLRKFLSFLFCLLVMFSAAPAWSGEAEEELFSRYFAERIKAESVLAVVSASDEELRRGAVPSLTICIERAPVGGALYDRILLVLKDVLFSRTADSVRVHSYTGSRLSGTILKKDFQAQLKKNMARYNLKELELKDGKIMTLGAYQGKGSIRMKATIRLKGAYVIDGAGTARIRFDESTNDNPFISAADVGRSVAKAAPVLTFNDFFIPKKLTEVRVDHDMIWFEAR